MFDIFTDHSAGHLYTAADHIRSSFANTKDGILYAYGPCRDEDDESDTVLRYEMNWTAADRDALIAELNAFCEGSGIFFVKENGLYKTEVRTRCRRFLRLMELKAPNVVVQTEVFYLSAVALLNRFAGALLQVWPWSGKSSLQFREIHLCDLGAPRTAAQAATDTAGIMISINEVDLCTLLSPENPKEYGHLDLKTLAGTLKEEHGVIACCGDCGWSGCWDAMVEIETREDAVFWKVTPHAAERAPLRFQFDRIAYDRALCDLLAFPLPTKANTIPMSR